MRMQMGVVTVWMEVLQPHGGVCLRGRVWWGSHRVVHSVISPLSPPAASGLCTVQLRERVSEGVVPSLIGGISELSGGEWWMG